MKYRITWLLLVLFLYSCSHKNVVKPQDYASYLSPHHVTIAVENSNTEIDFWQSRLAMDPTSFVNLLEVGYHHLGLFKLKGKIDDLKTGDSLIKAAARNLNYSDPDILQALSQVAITQHQFKNADAFNRQAYEKEGSPFIHALISFDVDMELGNFYSAKGKIDVLKNKESFDYLIRKAKYQDHIGDLDGGIELMEKAFALVASTNKKALYCWALANLGDMYGHAGRIEEAYRAYLSVLDKDPAYVYALKGIAWIAFAHDGNVTEAKKILTFINTVTDDPAIYLSLAEIASHEKDINTKEKYIQQFLNSMSNPAYAGMYNKVLIEIYTSDKLDLTKALQLASKEVENRPTPETYSWLAWVHYKLGNITEAYHLFVLHVKGRTFEPEASLVGATIMKAAGKKEEAQKYFEECLSSKFELGPEKISALKETMQ